MPTESIPEYVILNSRDGRKLDVMLGGNPTSDVALVCHHGTPSDASLWRGWNQDAVENDLRLVAISRPGYAFSDRKAQRTVACVAEDVEDVLDSLGISNFFTIGWSGGGPHALACASLLQSRCLGASILAGVAPHGEPDLDATSEMGPENIEHKRVTLLGEEALRKWADVNTTSWFSIADEKLAETLGGLVPEIDIDYLNNHGQATIWASSIRRCLQNGIDGYIDDSLVYCKDWGFNPRDIELPVTIWQGDLDLMVPFEHGQWLIKHIPNAISQLKIGEGHISLVAKYKQEMIDGLIKNRDFVAQNE